MKRQQPRDIWFYEFYPRILQENQHCFISCSLPVVGVTCNFSQGKFNRRATGARENYLARGKHEAPARRVSSRVVGGDFRSNLHPQAIHISCLFRREKICVGY